MAAYVKGRSCAGSLRLLFRKVFCWLLTCTWPWRTAAASTTLQTSPHAWEGGMGSDARSPGVLCRAEPVHSQETASRVGSAYDTCHSAFHRAE
eukprot:4285903-Amphidinium_carterae.1